MLSYLSSLKIVGFGKKAALPDCGKQFHYGARGWTSEIVLKMSHTGETVSGTGGL
jgi:hypothetical protein